VDSVRSLYERLEQAGLDRKFIRETLLPDRFRKSYQFQGQSLQLPPSLRFPPLREGNRVGRVGSVPPACRGNLKEGVIGHTRFCELWLRDRYQTDLSHAIGALDAYISELRAKTVSLLRAW